MQRATVTPPRRPGPAWGLGLATCTLITWLCALTPPIYAARPAAARPAAAPQDADPSLPEPPPLSQPQPPAPLGTPAAKEIDPATVDPWILRDRRPHNRTQTLSLSLGVWPPTTVSGALWYAIPVLPDGFIPTLNDSFDIEFGGVAAAFFDGADHGALIASVGGRWNVHLTRDWTPFVTLKLATRFGLGPYNPSWFDMGLSLGTLLRLQDSVWLRLELGYPTGMSIGVSFPIGG